MDLVIIGTGMYVSGRKTDGYGTILPAVLEFQRQNKIIKEIKIVGTNSKRAQEAKEKYEKLVSKMGVNLTASFYPKNNDSIFEYKNVVDCLKKPSCIIVAVPDNLHFEILKYVIERNHHALVVKPLTPTLEEGKKLVQLQKKFNVYGAVEFHKRWDKQNRILKDLFNSGKLGTPLYSWTEYSQRKSIPSKIFKSWVSENNILQYLGVHYIDIVRYVTKAFPKRVMSIGQKSFLKSGGINVHDAIQCLIEWETKNENTFTQTLLVNWIDPEKTSSMSDQKIKFVGTKGRYEGDQKDRGLITVFDQKNIEHINPDFCKSFSDDDGFEKWEGYGIRSIFTFLKDVNDILNNIKEPKDFENNRPTFSESLYSTSVIEASQKSLSIDSNWVKLDN